MSTLMWPAFPNAPGAANYYLPLKFPRGHSLCDLPRAMQVLALQLAQKVPHFSPLDYSPTQGEVDLFCSRIPSALTGPIDTDWPAVLDYLRIAHGIDPSDALPRQHIWVKKLVPYDQPLSPNQQIHWDIFQLVEVNEQTMRAILELVPLDGPEGYTPVGMVLESLRALPAAVEPTADQPVGEAAAEGADAQQSNGLPKDKSWLDAREVHSRCKNAGIGTSLAAVRSMLWRWKANHDQWRDEPNPANREPRILFYWPAVRGLFSKGSEN